MKTVDFTLVDALNHIGGWLGGEAQRLKEAMDHEDWHQIDKILAESKPKAAKLQSLAAQMWMQLAKLREAFVGATGTVVTR
jgi:hypothetical protein